MATAEPLTYPFPPCTVPFLCSPQDTDAMGVPDHSIDWTVVRPEKKWAVLRTQGRFLLWALYTSIGCIMMG